MFQRWAAAGTFWPLMDGVTAEAAARNKEAKVTWRKCDSQATPGDVVFWKFKSNKPIQDAAVVIAMSGSSVTIAQHSSNYRTSTMAAARSRNHPYSVWIAHVTPRW
ncbi:hypothetical protein [Streptomyces sp. NPDC056061]|uniref:hypothetical protein n=1 Tax=Streptomyces sp. NPDC056061 TaxID=3345700 RepID=UPI0035DA81BE